MDHIAVTEQSILFLQSATDIDLSTARTLINGRDHWLLVGDGWWQMGVYSIAKPTLDHPVSVLQSPDADTSTLLRLRPGILCVDVESD